MGPKLIKKNKINICSKIILFYIVLYIFTYSFITKKKQYAHIKQNDRSGQY